MSLRFSTQAVRSGASNFIKFYRQHTSHLYDVFLPRKEDNPAYVPHAENWPPTNGFCIDFYIY